MRFSGLLFTSFLVSLIFVLLVSTVSAQSVPDEIYEMVLGKQVIITKDDGLILYGKLEKITFDKVGIISQEGVVTLISKREIKDVKKDVNFDPNAKPGTKPVQKERIPRVLSPEDIRHRDELMSSYYDNMKLSNDFSTAGSLFIIPGACLDVVGGLSLILGYAGAFDKKKQKSGMSQTSEEYDTSLSEAFVSNGWICLGIGAGCTIIGAILNKLSDNRRVDAELSKNQADDLSFQFLPVLNPLNGSYGLSLSIRY